MTPFFFEPTLAPEGFGAHYPTSLAAHESRSGRC